MQLVKATVTPKDQMTYNAWFNCRAHAFARGSELGIYSHKVRMSVYTYVVGHARVGHAREVHAECCYMHAPYPGS